MVFVRDGVLLHVSVYEKRTLSKLLAGQDGLGRSLKGCVVEATFAQHNPEFLARLRELRVPYVIDPQSLRFAASGFEQFQHLTQLPYAPSAPLSISRQSKATEAMVRGAMEFQAEHSPDYYLTPALPILKPNSAHVGVFQQTHELARRMTMNGDVPKRPILALAAPSTQVLRDPYAVFEQLVDRANVDGVYVLPVRFNPKVNGVDWLVNYASFLRSASEWDLPVVASRAGAFGLVLTALGIHSFDSGLGERESYDLASQNRVRKPRDEDSGGGGPGQRHYLGRLMTSLPSRPMRVVFDSPTLRPWFICDRGGCRGGYEAQLVHRREHFAHERVDELDALARLPIGPMRVQYIADRLKQASEVAEMVNRVMSETGNKPIAFGHLATWSAVVTRIAEKALAPVAR